MEMPSSFLERILASTAKSGGTNLHLSVGSTPIMRVNGRLVKVENESEIAPDFLEKIISSILNDQELERFRKNKEIVVVKTFASNLRFQANIFYQKNLPSLSLSYIPNKIRSLSDLNWPQEVLKLIGYKTGLIIVSGSNDSGKTSAITAILEEINKTEQRYIITLEQPIKYLFVSKKSIIEQIEVGRDVPSFKEGLEHCLEEDVDVVYIDDTKDEFSSVIDLILELASGNSLVVLEVRAENTLRVLSKIISSSEKKTLIEARRYNLADSLLAIITQRLLPKRGGGLVAALEVFLENPAAKSLIREGKIQQVESIIQTSRNEGMASMRKAIADLVHAGKLDPEEAEKIKL